MRQPIRVLHVFGRMNRGGAETFIMNVYRHIDRGKIQFDFAVHSDEPGHYDEEIRSLGGRIFILPRPHLSVLPAYNRALTRLLSKEGSYAVVHSHVHFYSGIPLAIAASAGTPMRIAHSHNTSDGKTTTLPRRLYRRYMRHQMFRYATHMLGCSRAACEGLYGSRCWHDPRVQVVHYGIDLTPFESLSMTPKALRRKLGLPEDGYIVGHVGRFDVQKNHFFLIELFTHLLGCLPTARLVLVGDGPLRPDIERQVRGNGIEDRVFFLGVRADVPEIMGCVDAFLLPSFWEGIPLVLLEAQAAGVPCIVSDVISDESDLRIGLLFPVSLKANHDIWIEYILQAFKISRPPWSVRKEALRRNGYDVQQVAELLSSIYGS
ncbi:glycosyltransferase family 1 protein [Desulfosoma sp.]